MARPASTDKLAAYRAKRNFGLTPEPSGELAPRAERLRFVVQRHDARKLHYDFRLELEGTLKSWAVPKGPSLDPGDKRLAVQVEDHPLGYIDFEGDIPAHQYGAGHVDIWDSGYWEPQGDPESAYRAGKLKFRLEGEKLRGGWTLVRTRMPPRGGKEQWLLIKERDEDAHERTPAIDSEAADASDRSSAAPMRSAVENAVRAPLPSMLRPQLATLVDAPPQGGDWSYEVKFDGYRILARLEAGTVSVFTRDGKDWSAKLPHVVHALEALEVESVWLDGEIAVLDAHGAPSFQLLQNAFDRHDPGTIVYFLFDLPYLNGFDLRNTPLATRQRLLHDLLADLPPEAPLRLSLPLDQPPEKLLDSACRLALEGLIGKRRDSPYRSGRSADWIKLKCRQRQEFVIGGYTEPQGARKYFGALLLGVHDDDGRLRYVGRVGTGFDRSTLHALSGRMRPLRQHACPFTPAPPGSRAKLHWIKPELVAEVSFAEWTHDGLLRQAAFHGLREDKPASAVRREQAVHAPAKGRAKETAATQAERGRIEGVHITHPDRIIDADSGLTKLDLVRYYEQVAPAILPFLKRRPVYLLRAPEGVGGELFFQKHQNRLLIPGLTTFDPALDPGHAPLMAIESPQALVGAMQMGCVELHTCNATVDMIERPDCMVFDLDPDPHLSWNAVVEAAQLTKVALDELGLRAFLKTSGGKGLHVVVPLSRRHDWDLIAEFSRALAQHLARTIPSRFSAKMGAKNRVGKVFIDYLRNRRQASTVAPYSARARPGLPVATPIAWEELADITGPAAWTIRTLPQRLEQLEADPWKDFFKTRQALTKAMRERLGLGER